MGLGTRGFEMTEGKDLLAVLKRSGSDIKFDERLKEMVHELPADPDDPDTVRSFQPDIPIDDLLRFYAVTDLEQRDALKEAIVGHLEAASKVPVVFVVKPELLEPVIRVVVSYSNQTLARDVFVALTRDA